MHRQFSLVIEVLPVGVAVLLAVVAHLKIIERHRIRGKPVGVVIRAGGKRIVANQRIDESFILNQNFLSAVPIERPEGDPYQNANHRHVEENIANFAQIPALSTDRVMVVLFVPNFNSVVALFQDARRILNRTLGAQVQPGIRHGNLKLTVHRHTGKVSGGACRGLTPVFRVFDGSRGYASDQRNKQQQIDGREPRRGEHIEKLNFIGKFAPAGMVLNVIGNLGGVLDTLGENRARYRCNRQQKQKHERRVHFGQLSPAPAKHTHEPEGWRILARWFTGFLGCIHGTPGICGFARLAVCSVCILCLC